MAVVIGCGVNIAHVPEDTPYAVTSLYARAPAADPEQAFAAVAAGVEAALALFARGRGFGAVRERWLSHAVGVGQDVPCQPSRRRPDRPVRGARRGRSPGAAAGRRDGTRYLGR